MKTNTYISKQLTNAIAQLEMVTGDVSATLANAVPAGTANPIGASYAHALLSIDVMVNAALQGGAPVVFASGAAPKLGIADPNPQNWGALKAITHDIAALNAYAANVRASVQAYTAKLTDAELDRAFNFFGMDTTVADVLILAATQAIIHAGDISAIKGVNGLKGYPL